MQTLTDKQPQIETTDNEATGLRRGRSRRRRVNNTAYEYNVQLQLRTRSNNTESSTQHPTRV